jgi:hypothetical protein
LDSDGSSKPKSGHVPFFNEKPMASIFEVDHFQTKILIIFEILIFENELISKKPVCVLVVAMH